MVDHERYADLLARIAQTLITEYGVADVLHDLCDDIADLLGVSGAGVMLCDPDNQLRTAAASDEQVVAMETLQLAHAEGPCLAAWSQRAMVAVEDLTVTDLFPRFGPRALDVGMKAIAAFPMQVHDRHIGALGLYRQSAGPFTPQVCDAAQTLAASATAYVLNARALDGAVRLADQLQHALDSRVVIEQAKGKLSAQMGIDVRAAFELMRRYARDRSRKLRTVAEDVVEDRLVLGLRPPETPQDRQPLPTTGPPAAQRDRPDAATPGARV